MNLLLPEPALAPEGLLLLWLVDGRFSLLVSGPIDLGGRPRGPWEGRLPSCWRRRASLRLLCPGPFLFGSLVSCHVLVPAWI